ncbi:MAG: ABC transporter permease [Chthonomonas sp.]|nr:ABC transporter permease [Chthonomonas sp.]
MAKRLSTNPLAPKVYLLRETGKTVPLTLVIVLAVMLIAGIVSMINSIPLSIRTIYSYSALYAGFTPRGDASRTPEIRQRIEKESPVPLGRVMTARASEAVVKSIVGKWPFVILGLEQSDMDYYLQAMDTKSIDGRKPRPGTPEALISEPLARNLGLKLGSTLLGPTIDESFSPMPVKVVGIAQTNKWVAMVPIEYHRLYHFPPIDVLAVFTKDPAQQPEFDSWALEAFKGERTRVFVYEDLDKDTTEMFNILYRILNVVIGALVLVITFMMGMLMNIYQSQRLQEFGLLQALGYTRSALLRRVLGEAAMVVIGGWLLGVLTAFGLLNLVKRILMDPQAFALDPLDRTAYLYSIPVPIAILVVAGLTVMIRFRRFDPVGVVERRLV